MTRMITITLPDEAWDVLAETLSLDIDSGFIDPELRKEIEKAFEQVQIDRVWDTPPEGEPIP